MYKNFNEAHGKFKNTLLSYIKRKGYNNQTNKIKDQTFEIQISLHQNIEIYWSKFNQFFFFLSTHEYITYYLLFSKLSLSLKYDLSRSTAYS